MSSFGETLRNAREAKGLTCSQVAKQTHMLVQTVEEMEKEDFHRIPAPIYGRGFVRLFAECVGLDPLPLVREFMDIYEGRRAPTVRTREVPVVQPPPPSPSPVPEPEPVPDPVSIPEPESIPEPVPEPEPIPESIPEPKSIVPPLPPQTSQEPIANEAPPILRGLDLFEQASSNRSKPDARPLFPPKEEKPQPMPAPTPAPVPATAASQFDSPYLSSSAYGEGGPSAADRFRSSLTNVSNGVVRTVRNIPRSTWRITLLSLASLIVLVLLIWGIIALYKATSIKGTPQNEECPNGVCEFQPPAKTEKPTATPTDAKKPVPAPAVKQTEAAKTKPKVSEPTTKPVEPPKAKAPTSTAKSAEANKAKVEKPAKPQGPTTLQSTGQKIPPLYAD